MHYKGLPYEVLGVAHHSETKEALVVYKQGYDSEGFPKGSLWVRPQAMFLENVLVNGVTVPRFAAVES